MIEVDHPRKRNDGRLAVADARPPFGRLSIAELRKAVDSRAGRALVVSVAALTVVAVGGQLAFGEAAGHRIGALTATAMLPVSVLLPVVAVLSVTTEFSRRTALTTFALVPDRGRVVAAKAVAVSGVALVGTVVSAATAVAAFAFGAAAGRTVGGWGLPTSMLAQHGLVNWATMLCGLAFGLLLRQSPPALVAFYAVPIGWSAAGQLIPALATVSPWLDIGQSRVPLVEPGVTGREWAMFATSCLLWVVLPAAIGLIRIRHVDID